MQLSQNMTHCTRTFKKNQGHEQNESTTHHIVEIKSIHKLLAPCAFMIKVTENKYEKWGNFLVSFMLSG